MNIVRYLLVSMCVIGVVIFPPWVPLVLMGVLALFFRSWEVILIGLFADLVWLSGGVAEAWPLFTIFGLVLAWGLEPLRNELFSLSH
ncbi:hypothetical protein A2673_03855 [Candidatus Kaiserbacteria bacterium RIFCSPHIGHO2_01_FULL_50_13]|uniref:Uncharacterized protein n=1 Tax=Candidatus Kaiserbacteria bacterium RIFCSPLOWO2_01_FULL_50_24 TaxID=1798507 RepID=A0A1F6EIK2_9BACT|nr:MAG: hypothetical protein A2673_03855 [Candidatus Kaiserbacteria bacterium RIFCSPHIGHO2_01_FULL_50_13]OGG73485.1 MAG: hypothetical protein A3A34_01320 [Candidatus Kaiserbacteria bacterium RIFCSPLOWO2_01_FULL_50_24]OGG80850.1 MAG: hypothetical protein A3H74_02420 [Candidatus Kaiserbacteria bacterium RIFCSPLOWO2_02_FULL_51_13]